MAQSSRLESLLLRWRSLRQQGEIVEPEELCRDCPELLADFQFLIATLPPDLATPPVPQSGKEKPGSGASATPAYDGPPPGELSLSFLQPAQQSDELGRLSHYRVFQVLGRGGMGMVLRAEDTKLQRLVALKVILPWLADDALVVARFLREARAVAAIEHDNVVSIYQVDEDGVPFLAMPLLKGEPLADRLDREGKLSLTDLIRIGREMAAGLAAAHDKGLIHRDVKPSNVWLEAPSGRVKLLDFGLARSGNDGSLATRSGAILGTPAYMSPEQAKGKLVDARSDLFSLGCVLYHAATGDMPFGRGDPFNVLAAVLMNTPAPPDTVNRRLPKEVSKLIMRLLAKDPADRPASAAQVGEELRAIKRALTAEPLPLELADRPPPLPHTALEVLPIVEPKPAERAGRTPTPRETPAPRTSPRNVKPVTPPPQPPRSSPRTEVVPPEPALPVRRAGSKWIAIIAIGAIIGMAGAGAAIIIQSSRKDASATTPATNPAFAKSDEPKKALDPKLVQSIQADLRDWELALNADTTGLGYLSKAGPGRVTVWKSAAENGLAAAQVLYGECLRTGIGAQLDPTAAFTWFEKSAAQNEPAGLYKVGTCYENWIGVGRDDMEMLRWYRRAADRGFAAAQYSYGSALANGVGTKRDEVEGVVWYRKAAVQGYAMSQYLLGWCCENGIGTTKDKVEAARWYRKSADQGLPLGYYAVGKCYETGTGVTADDGEMVKWYRLAADQNNFNGQLGLGWCYHVGRGVPLDYAKAMEWYRKAAEQGSARAQYNIGLLYENGQGVKQDVNEAAAWFRKAADQNYDEAKAGLVRLGLKP